MFATDRASSYRYAERDVFSHGARAGLRAGPCLLVQVRGANIRPAIC